MLVMVVMVRRIMQGMKVVSGFRKGRIVLVGSLGEHVIHGVFRLILMLKVRPIT